MKPLGRLICLCVGVFMIFFGVMAIKENVELLAVSGWEDIVNVPYKLQRLITILETFYQASLSSDSHDGHACL